MQTGPKAGREVLEGGAKRSKLFLMSTRLHIDIEPLIVLGDFGFTCSGVSVKRFKPAQLIAISIAVAMALYTIDWRGGTTGRASAVGEEELPEYPRLKVSGLSTNGHERLREPATDVRAPSPGRLPTPEETSATPNPPVATNAGLKADMPERIKILLKKPYHRPSSADILAIKPSDADYLVNLYRGEPILTNRIAAMYALAATGDQRALVLFENTLSSEFAGQSLPYTDVKIMVRHLEAIGMLARSSDASFAYLERGTSLSEWNKGERRKWRSADRTEELTNRSLACGSVRAIGMSGRPESVELIERLSREPLSEVYPISGAVVDAAFFHDYRDQHGNQDWLRSYFDGGMFDAFVDWTRETEQGRRWLDWANGVESAGGRSDR